jgi:acetyl esterase/lipase
MKTAAFLAAAAFCGSAYAGGVTVQRDVAYGTDDRQKLDVYVPPEAGAGARGAIVFFHGGGFRGGNKDAFAFYAREAAAQGYVGIAANYRLAPRHRYPAAVEDAASAVRWISENAARYKVDPKRVCAVGSSAGGHLVAMLAARGLVACAVDYFGPVDFTRMSDRSSDEVAVISNFLGKTPAEAPELWAEASPVTQVSKRSSPLLAIHGTADARVPISQSETLVEKLKGAGAEAELIRIEGAGHGFHNQPDTTDAQNAWKAALAFLRRFLR